MILIFVYPAPLLLFPGLGPTHSFRGVERGDTNGAFLLITGKEQFSVSLVYFRRHKLLGQNTAEVEIVLEKDRF